MQTITEFLSKNPFGVLAVIGSDGNPYTSALYFKPFDNNGTMELHFVTDPSSKKMSNIKVQPNVSVCFTSEQELTVLQLTGTVEEMPATEQADHLEPMLELIHSRVPDRAPVSIYRKEHEQVFKITNLKGRLATFKDDKMTTVEL